MKIIALVLLPLLYITAYLLGTQRSDETHFQTKVQTSATELTDLKNVAYARNLRDYKNHKIDSLIMDIYYPTGATSDKKYPVIMFYHAGGFAAGNHDNVMTICDRFADEGFIAVGIDYRVGYLKNSPNQCTSDSTTFMAAHYRGAQDANAAIRYLVANAAQYNVDTNWIFIAGSSAGASLSLFQAFVNDTTAKVFYPYLYNQLGSLYTSGNSYTNQYKVKGICAMWGSLQHAPDLITKNNAIPTIIFKGEEDGGTPDSAGYFNGCLNMPYIYAGVAIYDYLRAQNAPSVFYYLPLASHPAYDNGFCVQNAACFFRGIMANKTYSGVFQNFQPSCPDFTY